MTEEKTIENESAAEEPFDIWGTFEAMGHRRLVGRIRIIELAGAQTYRVDALTGENGETIATQFYHPQALYAITPMSEKAARKAAHPYGWRDHHRIEYDGDDDTDEPDDDEDEYPF